MALGANIFAADWNYGTPITGNVTYDNIVNYSGPDFDSKTLFIETDGHQVIFGGDAPFEVWTVGVEAVRDEILNVDLLGGGTVVFGENTDESTPSIIMPVPVPSTTTAPAISTSMGR